MFGSGSGNRTRTVAIDSQWNCCIHRMFKTTHLWSPSSHLMLVAVYGIDLAVALALPWHLLLLQKLALIKDAAKAFGAHDLSTDGLHSKGC